MYEVGDRVMMLIDDKFLNIAHGDTGRITNIGVLGLIVKLDKNDKDWYMGNEQVVKI